MPAAAVVGLITSLRRRLVALVAAGLAVLIVLALHRLLELPIRVVVVAVLL
jgi:hypothetical protein